MSNKMPSAFFGSNGREYAIGSQLGTGSSGTVFTCTDLSDDNVYAVKVVKLQHMKMSMTGEEYEFEKNKLHREVNILKHLSHPNIVKLVDVSESNDSVYVVQELIEGGELFSRITDDPNFRNENVIKQVYCQLADALLYLHSRSVIHRDIKPENILVQSCDPTPPPGVDPIPNCPVYPVIKVVDFGLSKEITSMASLAQTWVGTPQYWAPEVIQAREKGTPYDGRADLWSVGVLLYVCLCRRYPFTEPKYPGDPSMQDRILKGQFTFPGTVRIKDEAKDLINKLIVPEKEKRITLEESFSHAWFKNFTVAKILSQRWPVSHTVAIETGSLSRIPENEVALPAIISEPSSVSSASPSPVSRKDAVESSQAGGEDLVPFIFPSPPTVTARIAPPPSIPTTGSVSNAANAIRGVVAKYNGGGDPPVMIPNIALAQQAAVDQFQLAELARVQNEIIICFYKIQNNFLHHPHAFHLMSSMTARARDLQFVSATTVSRFAITAELTETIIEDSAAFVEAGAIEASLECVEEVRQSVVEMMTQCRVVQEHYHVLLEDVNNLIAGSRIVLNSDPTVRQALEDILRSEESVDGGGNTEQRMNSVSPERDRGGTPPPSSAANNRSSVGNGSRTSLITQNDALNSMVAGMSSQRLSGGGRPSPTIAPTESVLESVLSIGIEISNEDGELIAAATAAEDPSTEQLLESSLRDLRRVDDILGKCRFFWSNVEQCLLRLDHFRTTGYRLLENIHLSRSLMDRYLTRVEEHKAFWSKFKNTCAEYAKNSQIEYQKFLAYDNAN